MATHVKRECGWQGKILKFGTGEFEESFPVAARESTTFAADPLVVADLFKPEAGGRRVQQPQQRKVVVLTRTLRQLNHRRRTIKYPVASVEREMIMCRDETEGNRPGVCPAVFWELVP